ALPRRPAPARRCAGSGRRRDRPRGRPPSGALRRRIARARAWLGLLLHRLVVLHLIVLHLADLLMESWRFWTHSEIGRHASRHNRVKSFGTELARGKGGYFTGGRNARPRNSGNRPSSSATTASATSAALPGRSCGWPRS